MLYFIRHGQTDANLNHLSAGGEWDLPLNATGILQAKSFGAENNEFLKTIDKFYISPMIRAQQTAHFIAEALAVKPPTETIEELREWDLGEWSGRHHSETPDYFTGNHPPPGGETYVDFQNRILKALNKIANNDDNERALVVAHGGIWFAYSDRIHQTRNFLENCKHGELCRLSLKALLV